MARKKTRAALEEENRILRRYSTGTGFVSSINALIKWGAIVLMFRYSYLSIASLAGLETSSNIFIKLATDFKANQYMPWAVGVGGVGYGFSQRKLRKKSIARLHAHTREVERIVDQRRSSSKLTSKGDTRPEDR